MFGIISELTFGKSYGMIHGSQRWVPKYLAETTALLNFMGNFPTSLALYLS